MENNEESAESIPHLSGENMDKLPSPSQLVSEEDTVKVTLALSRASVAFFKSEAKLHGTPYQKMIRKLLDLYSKEYAKECA